MDRTEVTSTEFQTLADHWLNEAGSHPIFITRDGRPIRVLIDFDDYERLKRYDTRQAFYAHELPEEILLELEKGWQGEPTPELDHLLEDEPRA